MKFKSLIYSGAFLQVHKTLCLLSHLLSLLLILLKTRLVKIKKVGMFKVRVLLFFIGVLGIILGTESYSYYAPPLPDPSYGYAPYGQAHYASYGPPAYGGGYAPKPYSAPNCAYMKVLEVLDQIFCQHGTRKPYSSTIYPQVDLIINQVTYLIDFCFLQTVTDYLNAAVQTLKTLQDALYTSYGDSSLLKPYTEDITETGETENAQEATTSDTKAQPNRITAVSKLAKAQTSFAVHEQNGKLFKANRNNREEETKTQHHNQKEDDVKQRAAEGENEGMQLRAKTTEARAERAERSEELSKLRKRMTQLKRDAQTSSRRARDSEYSDYLCPLLPQTYCEGDKYDELLFNMLDRLFTALGFLDQAAFETWLFMDEIGCKKKADREALEEAAITYGAIITDYYTLLELTIQVVRMYELVELEYPDDGYGSSYYRAGGGSSSNQNQMNRKPMTLQMNVNRTPVSQGYPFSQYVTSQSQSSTPAYSPYSPYRTSRSVPFVAVPRPRRASAAPKFYLFG